MKEELNQKDGKSKIYEIGFHLLPTIGENDINTEVSKIKDIIEKNNGVFISEGTPQLTNLAYSITKAIAGKKHKFDNAYFGWIKFDLGGEIEAIKKQIDDMESILRYLIIKTVKEDTLSIKSGKFAFGDNNVVKEDAEEDDKKVSDEEEGEEIETEKDLDDTIDDLVIE